MDQDSIKNLFTGGMDLDIDKQLLDDGDYLRALNIRNQINGPSKGNVVTNVKGNTLVPYTQPAGINKAIGAFKNASNSSIIFMVYNSLGNHQIRRYNQDNTIDLIMEHDFGWEEDKYITNINLIDDLLYWTDTECRKINVKKAFNGNKKLCWDVVLTPGVSTFVFYFNGGIFFSKSYTFPADSYQDIVNDLTVEFDNRGNNMEAQVCASAMEICQTADNNGHTLELVASEGIAIPRNFYQGIVGETWFAGKAPQNCMPRVELKLNRNVTYDYITNQVFQFRTRMVYDDYEKSVLSPISDINVPECNENYNFIEVDFTEPRLLDATQLGLIRGVEVFVRVTNEGIWKLIKFIPVTELWIDSGRINNTTFNFFNDSITTALDNATANRQFDALPIGPTDDNYSICQESADSRIIYANFTENYERPCIDASLDIAFSPAPVVRRFNIQGLIRIYCRNQFRTGFGAGSPGAIGAIYKRDNEDEFPSWGGAAQTNVLEYVAPAYDQRLPENGWPVYLAGTEYLGISKQNPGDGLAVIGATGIIDATNAGLIDDLKTWYADYSVSPGARGDMRSDWEIKSVLPGIYNIAVGSHLCSFGDKLGYGSFYNLNNNILFQRTSTNTYKFNPAGAPLDLVAMQAINPGQGDNYRECIIKINEDGSYEVSAQGTVLISVSADPNRENIYVGDFIIEDISNPSSTLVTDPLRDTLSGYLLDNGGGAALENIENAISVELQNIRMQVFNNQTGVTDRLTTFRPTDRNGYFYFSPGSVGPLETIMRLEVVGLAGARVHEFSDGLYVANLSEIYNEEGTLFSDGRILAGTPPDYVAPKIIVFNQDANFTQNGRTTITGNVSDSNGNGIKNIIVGYERNGRPEATDINGDFSIVVYGDAIQNLNQRVFDLLLLNSPIGCYYSFDNTGLIYDFYQLLISQFGIDYNNTTPFAPNYLNSVIVNKIQQTTRKFLKNGGRYRIACRHVDGVNRRHALYTEAEWNMYIPFTTQNMNDYYPSLPSQQSDGSFNLTLTLNSQPPIEAEYFYIYRTKDAIYGEYLQFPVADVKYVLYFDSATQTIIETSWASRTAKEVYIQFEQSLLNYQDFNSGSNKSWIFTEGDRIRFIRNDRGQLFPDFVDLPILNVRDGYYIVDATDALGEILPGALIEVYSPKKKADDDIEEQMFEIPICIKVLDPGTPLRRYERTTILLDTGDTYRRTRIVPVPGIGTVVSDIEDNSISDFFDSRDEDIGRFDILDDTFGKLIRTNAYRFSNRYEAGTKLNGLSSFEGASVIEIGRNFGAVKSLKLTNDGNEREVLLSIFENRCVSIYVGASILNDLADTDIVALSSQVLGAYRALKGDFGTTNPESVWLEDGNVRWWDGLRGKFSQYGINGLVAISDYKIRSYAASIPKDVKVVSVYDEYYGEWIATVLAETVRSTTIAFNDQINRWVSFYSFLPELYSSSGRSVVSFQNGECWVHDTNAIRNNFYGVQYVSQINCISKSDPISMKMFLRARVQGNNWYMPEIITLPNDSYPVGMRSRLLKNNWALKEGEYWADFLRDINDPQYQSNIQLAIFEGRKLRGQVLQTLLENDQTDEATIRMLEVYSVTSERGNP